jgi:hypothetical protein
MRRYRCARKKNWQIGQVNGFSSRKSDLVALGAERETMALFDLVEINAPASGGLT